MLRRVFIAVCLMIPFALSALPQLAPPAGAQFFTDYVRRLNAPVFNYGSKATIGTNTSPYVESGDWTGEFVESTKAGNGDLHGVASGWMAGQAICGPVAGNSTTLAWMEPFGEGCMMQNVFGDITYSNEYDGNSGYWCHDKTGSCYRSASASTLGMYDSSGVDLLGWVSSADGHGEVTTMGNHGQSNAIYLTNPSYKPSSTAPPSSWLSITSGVSGVNCSPANPYSAYKVSCSTAASVWYAYNWTIP